MRAGDAVTHRGELHVVAVVGPHQLGGLHCPLGSVVLEHAGTGGRSVVRWSAVGRKAVSRAAVPAKAEAKAPAEAAAPKAAVAVAAPVKVKGKGKAKARRKVKAATKPRRKGTRRKVST